jgi:DNA (cytosine-5)-methyltransferase 1
MNNVVKKLRIFEAFAGIGAQRKALENINKKYEVVGLAEWFVPAIVAYEAIHNRLAENIDNKKPVGEMIDFLESLTLSIDSKKQIKKGYWVSKYSRERERERAASDLFGSLQF